MATQEKTQAAAPAAKQWVRDERGYIVGQGKERFGITPIAITDDDANDMGRPTSHRLAYLEGVRGLLGLQTLLWIFFRLFAPAIVTDTDLDGTRPALFVTHSPEWMSVLRKVLSPLLFDGSLQMAGFITLMGRVSLQTFIERRAATALAGQCTRRPVRLFLPVALGLALASVVSVTNGFRHADWLSQRLDNAMLAAPPVWESAILYVNSVVTFFMGPRTLRDSRAAVSYPPYGVMWFIQVMFQQTYVLTVVAWTLPYTVLKYKVIGGLLFVVLSAWVARWSWYTVTGLLLCEFSVLHRQTLPQDQVFVLRGRRIPYSTVPVGMMLLGAFFKYLWIAALPSKQDNEYVFHASINTGKLLRNIDPSKEAFPRYDDWLLVAGLFALLELSPRLRAVFALRPLVLLGRLSFSIILVSATVMMSLGALFYRHLVEQAGITSLATLTGLLFLVLIPLCLICATVWSVTVDQLSLWLSHAFYRFITT